MGEFLKDLITWFIIAAIACSLIAFGFFLVVNKIQKAIDEAREDAAKEIAKRNIQNTKKD